VHFLFFKYVLLLLMGPQSLNTPLCTAEVVELLAALMLIEASSPTKSCSPVGLVEASCAVGPSLPLM